MPRDPWSARAVLFLYPPRWRERYGEEFACLLADLASGLPRPARARLIANAAIGALDARLHPRGGTAMPDRIRRQLATAACAALAFAIAIAGLAKLREDPDFAALARGHAAVAVPFDVLRAAAVAAGLVVLAAAVPLGWAVLRQVVAARRVELIRPLVFGPAAAAAWVAAAWGLAAASRHRQPQAGPDLPAVAAIAVLGAVAAVICGWAAVSLIRRAEFAPRLLRAQVVLMALLAVCLTAAAGADLAWGLAIRSADPALFRSDYGLVATPLAPNWAGSVVVLAAIAAMAVVAAARAARLAPDAAGAGRG